MSNGTMSVADLVPASSPERVSKEQGLGKLAIVVARTQVSVEAIRAEPATAKAGEAGVDSAEVDAAVAVIEVPPEEVVEEDGVVALTRMHLAAKRHRRRQPR